jgi:D-cysteine desulfhydrase
MTSVLVLRGDAPKEYQGNLLLDCLFGARFEFLDPDDYFHLIDGRMEAQAEAAREKGLVPYIIPLGGANPLGALGYVRAAEEIAGQLAASTMKAPDIIVAPVGSGGTVAGLQVGCGKHLPGTRIVGISVSRDRAWFQKQIARMASECAELLDWPDRWSPDDIWIEDGYVGPGYGKASDGGIAAIREAACTEGLLLDPIYTGKAMHGLKDLCQRGAIKPGERVMFLHCGGSPALYPFAKVLTGT